MNEPESCVFCRIAAGVENAYVVCENELSTAILDINPLARGHCLVIPRRHVQWWHELTVEESQSLFELAHEVARRVTATLEPDFVCMYIRGRRIAHTHVFLVPTWDGDPVDRHFNALEGFQEGAARLSALASPDSMAEVASQLRNP
jgi:histidine triad (HIT) family protein